MVLLSIRMANSPFDVDAEYCKLVANSLKLYEKVSWSVLQHSLVALAVAATFFAISGVCAVIGSLLLPHRWLKRRTFNGALLLLQVVVVALYFVFDSRRIAMSLARHGIGSNELLLSTTLACATHVDFPVPKYSDSYDYHFSRNGIHPDRFVVFIGACISGALLLRLAIIPVEPPMPPPPPSSDADFAKLSGVPSDDMSIC